jgi:sulfate transport system ATP-binding protein
MSIEVKNLSKYFGSFTALNDVSLNFPDGQLTALLGPSGCGKTTLLRIIAGLEVPDQGQVLFDGVDTTDEHVRDRNVGFVFQHYALFKHMSVFENVAFGLRVKPKAERLSNKEIAEKVHRLLNLVQLDWLADRYPSQLSGGQRQRIALARALAVEPKVLLLDEPFGALDAKVRKELRRWLRRLHDELHVTSIFVTHDQEEALEVADKVVLMNHGVVEQIDTPEQVYANPATPFVYGFLGNVNLFHGRVEGQHLDLGEAKLPLTAAGSDGVATAIEQATAYVRPHEISITKVESTDSITGGIRAKFNRAYVIGPSARLELERAETGEWIEVDLPVAEFQALALQTGDYVWAQPSGFRVFPKVAQ